MTDIAVLVVATAVAGFIGTLTGFGISTILVPVALLFLPLPQTLLLVGIIHWFGDVWKMILFRGGLRLKLLLGFAIPGVVAAWAGAKLAVNVPSDLLVRILGSLLIVYVMTLVRWPAFRLAQRWHTAAWGGAVSGFLAGMTGIGGEVRGATLAAYNLPKSVYLFTAGAIAILIDSTRLATYWTSGVRLDARLTAWLVILIAVSLLASIIAQRIVHRIPQRSFRIVVAVFLLVVGIKLLIWP